MFLSRMALDIGKPETMKALISPNLFHGAVEQAFSGERRRNLWRIDSLNGKRYILILSADKPDYSHMIRQFGDEQENVAIKDYTNLLERIRNDGVWHFRLVANPSVATIVRDKHRVVSHVTVEQQKKWLLDRAEKNGFALDQDSFDVVWRTRYNFRKADHNRVQFSAAAFEGWLTVKEENRFKELLINGIGRERAYGMGLMTVVKGI